METNFKNQCSMQTRSNDKLNFNYLLQKEDLTWSNFRPWIISARARQDASRERQSREPHCTSRSSKMWFKCSSTAFLGSCISAFQMCAIASCQDYMKVSNYKKKEIKTPFWPPFSKPTFIALRIEKRKIWFNKSKECPQDLSDSCGL